MFWDPVQLLENSLILLCHIKDMLDKTKTENCPFLIAKIQHDTKLVLETSENFSS